MIIVLLTVCIAILQSGVVAACILPLPYKLHSGIVSGTEAARYSSLYNCSSEMPFNSNWNLFQ